jgi:uncharacterized protein YxjI
MREKMFAIGDDFWIETADGERAFKVNGKALRVRQTFILESPGGDELYKIQEKKLSIRDKMEIERDGDTVAEISKRWFRVRDTYGIEVGPEQDDALILAITVCIDQMSRVG